MCAASVAVPEDIVASEVLRHSRSLPSTALTFMARSLKLTMYAVPVSSFSGRPAPLDVGAKRGSRQVPVHSEEGSILALAQVSLYDTRVRYAVWLVSADGS